MRNLRDMIDESGQNFDYSATLDAIVAFAYPRFAEESVATIFSFPRTAAHLKL